MRGIIINPLLSQRLALSSLFRFLFSVAAKGYYFIAKNINAIAFIGFVKLISEKIILSNNGV